MALPPIPTDILAAEISLRSELFDSIFSLIDASQLTTVTGGNNDQFIGSNLAETIDGFSGNDVIAGFGGNDRIFSGEGDDYVLGGIGDDRIDGGDGNDIMFGEAGNDVLIGGAGDDAMFGGSGIDTLTGGEGNDWLYGNSGADRLTGGFGDDIVDGGTENDILTGDAGNDHLIGGAGADRLDGGVDNDILFGGAGADRMTGGVGDDVFYYSARSEGRDLITDFSSGDRFELYGLGFGVDAGTNLENGVTFVANTAPSSVTNLATVLYDTDNGRVFFDMDGTGAMAAQLIATLTGNPQVNADDFSFV